MLRRGVLVLPSSAPAGSGLSCSGLAVVVALNSRLPLLAPNSTTPGTGLTFVPPPPPPPAPPGARQPPPLAKAPPIGVLQTPPSATTPTGSLTSSALYTLTIGESSSHCKLPFLTARSPTSPAPPPASPAAHGPAKTCLPLTLPHHPGLQVEAAG
jgi:hypothetical protein